MSFIIRLLSKVSIICASIIVFVLSFLDIISKYNFLGIYTNYFEQIDNYINLADVNILYMLLAISLFYVISFQLDMMHIIKKYSKKRRVKSKKGEVEVTLATINNISEEFLLDKDMINSAKVRSYEGFRSVIIEANINAISEENLSKNILDMQEELANHVENITGIKIRKIKIKIKKILNGDTISEKTVRYSKKFKNNMESNDSLDVNDIEEDLLD